MSDQTLLASLTIVSVIIAGLLAFWKSEQAQRDKFWAKSIKELKERTDSLEKWKDEAIVTIDKYQTENYHTQRKLDRVIDYSRGLWRETRDLIALAKKGVPPTQEHINKLESWPLIDDVLKEFE